MSALRKQTEQSLEKMAWIWTCAILCYTDPESGHLHVASTGVVRILYMTQSFGQTYPTTRF